MSQEFKPGRNFQAEAVARIGAYLQANPRSTRNEVLLKTGCGVPDFQIAVEALNLVRHFTNGAKLWTVPTTRAEPTRINVMQSAPYVEQFMAAPRAGSMAYKSIQSVGMPT